MDDNDESVTDELYNPLRSEFNSLSLKFKSKNRKRTDLSGNFRPHSLRYKERELRLIEFNWSRNLAISSTCFPIRRIHKRTLASPDGAKSNQIDQVFIEKRIAFNILDVSSYFEANFDSNRYFVRARHRCRMLLSGLILKSCRTKDWHRNMLGVLEEKLLQILNRHRQQIAGMNDSRIATQN